MLNFTYKKVEGIKLPFAFLSEKNIQRERVRSMNKDDRYLWKLKRQGKGIILKEVAEYVGLSISMVNQHENGKKNMAEDSVRAYKHYIENKTV